MPDGCERLASRLGLDQYAEAFRDNEIDAPVLPGLTADDGRHGEAVDTLAPVYAWFTEGFDTADLRDAKALLDALQ